jgi:hypothetical protein
MHAVPKRLAGAGANPGVRHSILYHGATYRAVLHPFHWLKILIVASGMLYFNVDLGM